MKVILLKDVKGVGRRFEEKNISDGYAINFLIPKKLAVASLSAAAGQVRALMEQEKKSKETQNKTVSENISKLSGTTVEVKLAANEQGHLFASLSKEKIADLIKEKGIEIDASSIDLEQPLKEIGSHTLPIIVGDKITHFTLIISKK